MQNKIYGIGNDPKLPKVLKIKSSRPKQNKKNIEIQNFQEPLFVSDSPHGQTKYL